ncbi:MAG: alcohol dehydrogenase [Deltaproteobacteria bacterium]|nr:MAG: alcohol dehydrogenase [Deltaproteobacteria bacterium]
MKAMVLERTVSAIEEEPEVLVLKDLPIPEPGPGEVLVEVLACGICRTELDEIEGRRKPRLPVIPGHEVVGRVVKLGPGVSRLREGDRVGVGWIYSACGKCRFCEAGEENLCEEFRGTGCDEDGGYAEYMVVREDFAFPIPSRFGDLEAAPLLCAGAIGYRALRLTGMKDGEILGLFGFGASAHIVYQVARHLFPRAKIFVFTRRKGDAPSELARQMGADWVGETGEMPPERVKRAIDTTPSGAVVREALKVLDRGGRLVINAIRKEGPIPELDYADHMWLEKEIKTVANIARRDIAEFLPLAAEIPILPEIKVFDLREANEALLSLKRGGYRGAGVLKMR